MKVDKALRKLGFYWTETGGGCTAYQRDNDDGTWVLVTRAQDATAPDDNSDWICIGFYDEGNPVGDVTCPLMFLLNGTITIDSWRS